MGGGGRLISDDIMTLKRGELPAFSGEGGREIDREKGLF